MCYFQEFNYFKYWKYQIYGFNLNNLLYISLLIFVVKQLGIFPRVYYAFIGDQVTIECNCKECQTRWIFKGGKLPKNVILSKWPFLTLQIYNINVQNDGRYSCYGKFIGENEVLVPFVAHNEVRVIG